MKKFKFFAMALMAVSLLASCDKSSPKMDEKPVNQPKSQSAGIKIAYLEVDSLMTQYKFCKEYTALLEKKGANARNTLTKKGQQLQAAANNFQQKLQNNGFQSREQAEAVQSGLQRSQQDLQELQARLENELNQETAKYNQALRDSLQSFLKIYNKDKKYDMILSKAGDNILFANKQYDITNDVVNGLNKRYKSNRGKSDTAKKIKGKGDNLKN